MLLASGCTDEVGGQAVAEPAPTPERWQVAYATESENATLFDIAPVAKDEGWAIGQVATDEVLFHGRDGHWQQTAMPLPTARGLFNIHLAGSAPDNVWLFAGSSVSGANGESTDVPAARRWDGQQWLTIPVTFTATDIAVLSPSDVWVLDAGLSDGRPVTQHWDGHGWTAHVLPDPAEALSASGPENVWAVGWRDDPTGRTQAQPATMRFDGRDWQSVPTPDDPPTSAAKASSMLKEVVAVSPDDVWAFGVHDDNPAASDPTIRVLHWDGSAWRTAARAPEYTVDIHPFPDMVAAGDGADGFVLAGYQHGGRDGTLRVIGYPAPPPANAHSGSPTGQFQANDVKLVPGTRDVWAAGFMEGGGGDARGVVVTCTLNG